MKFKTDVINVDIECEHGIYVLDNYGGVGKTYLCTILKEATQSGLVNARVLTYADYAEFGEEAVLAVLEKKADIYVLDRFNSYSTKAICDVIKTLSASSTVLLDLKRDRRCLSGIEYKTASVSLQRDRIEVVGNAYVFRG